MQDQPNAIQSAGQGASRREFLATTAAGLAALGLAPWSGSRLLAGENGPEAKPASETLVTQFYKSLTQEQKKALCFPFDHPLRSKIDNNWMITDTPIEKLTADQQALVKEIFNGLHSPEYAERVMQQVEHDSEDIGGFKACSVALFGDPSTTDAKLKPQFEFVLTGRHVTRRCDGNATAGAAFGGPIFYGHAGLSFFEKPDHEGNVYWYQAKRANEVFKALNGKQREQSLRTDPRREQATKTVELAGDGAKLSGLPFSDMSADQKDLVRKVMADVLAPFRKADADEALKCVDASGWDKLHLSFFKNLDVGKDGVWDVWQLEGPDMLWYFRGYPHVHTWVHIREPKKP